MKDVAIVLPPVSDDQVSADLRWLTEALMTRGAETSGGLLGGEFGYGAEFDNEVFEMHPFWWGDCECGYEAAEWDWAESHSHSPDCYQSVIRERGYLDYDSDVPWERRDAVNEPIVAAACAEMGLDPNFGTAVHCTCSYQPDWLAWVEANPHPPTCPVVRPNFRHKPSGSTVSWYKYIGRGMEVDLNSEWRNILADCVASL